MSFSDAGAPIALALEPGDRDVDAAASSAAHRLAAQAAKRYSDAYLVANAITGWASLIKSLGLVAAVAVFGTVAAVAGRGAAAAFIAFIPAALVAFSAYGIAIIVSAQGQILKASLDSAVHSSPFLRDEQRVQVMSL